MRKKDALIADFDIVGDTLGYIVKAGSFTEPTSAQAALDKYSEL